MSYKAPAGDAADGAAGLRKRPPTAAVFREIGILPNKRFEIGKPISLLAKVYSALPALFCSYFRRVFAGRFGI